MATQRYSSVFKNHISFFDLNRDGLISHYESFRNMLSLGLNFPFAVAMTTGLHILYGNAGLFGLGGIAVQDITQERTQLQGLRIMEKAHTRSELIDLVRDKGWMDHIHVMGLWGLAADKQGRVSARDITLFQRGELLPELQRRRRLRQNAVPFSRGGPFS